MVGLLLFAICGPSAALAAPEIGGSGVERFWGNSAPGSETLGGRFGLESPRGLAVYDASGNVFAVDTDSNRIEQFDGDGAFIRAFGLDVVQSGKPGDLGTAVLETCSVKTDCKAGVTGGVGGALNKPAGIAINQANGHIYVVDTSNARAQELRIDDNGTAANPADDLAVFVRAWGQDVVQTGKPEDIGTGFEVCVIAANCKAGTAGTAGAATTGATGGVLNSPGFPAVAPQGAPNAGHVLIADPSSNRVQEFTATGAFVRAFGGGVVNGGAEGTGNLTTSGTEAQKKTVTAVSTTKKAFIPGQTITGAGIAPGTVITAVAATTLTLSKEATATVSGATLTVVGGSGNAPINEQQTFTLPVGLATGTFKLRLKAPQPQTVTVEQTTVALPYSASAAEVETALANLTNIGAGNVAVSGAAGGPYAVDFQGSRYADTNVEQLTIAEQNGFTWAVGAQRTCTGGPTGGLGQTTVSYQWLSNGAPATGAGANTATYMIAPADAGKALQCRVTATHTAGIRPTGAVAVSAANNVATPSGPLPGAPGSIVAPTGNTSTGENLTCNAGSWTNAPTSYTYQWVRNGSQVLETETKATTTDAYTLQAADVATAAVYQCLVTGTNANGSVTKASLNKTSTGPTPEPFPPTATVSLTEANVTTLRQGAGGFEVCAAAAECQAGIPFLLGAQSGEGAGLFASGAVNRVAEDGVGRIYTVEAASNQGPGASNFRVQRFTLPSDVVTPQGAFACTTLCGSSSVATKNATTRDNPSEVAVDDAGNVYVVKAFLSGQGTPPARLPANSEEFQLRVLKLDPNTEALTATFLANTDQRIHAGVVTIAPSGAGLPLYAGVQGASNVTSRIFRLGALSSFSATTSVSEVSAASALLDATIAVPVLPDLNTYYYFEYTRAGAEEWASFRAPPATSTQDLGVNIGNGADGGESSSCSAEVGKRAAICHVSQEIDGLERDELYEFRLHALTDYNGLIYTSDPVQFETGADSPTAVTDPAIWSGPPASGPSLVMNGRVNPQGAQTTFGFQYVSKPQFEAGGFSAAQTAPAFPRDIGHGVVSLNVSAVAKPDPSLAYVYRIFATNPEGTSFGAAEEVEPPQAGERFVELVSAGDGQGIKENGFTVSDDGERAKFTAFALSGQPSAPFITNPNIAQRGAQGWSVVPVGPDPGDAAEEVTGGFGYGDAEVSRRLWLGTPAAGSFQWTARGLDGVLSELGPQLTPIERSGVAKAEFQGAADDFDTVLFSLKMGTLVPGESLVDPSSSNLYAITGANGDSPLLRLVNRDGAGVQLGGACGAQLGGGSGALMNSVSADGSVVYFGARPTAAPGSSCATAQKLRVFKRIDNASTVAVSASQCSRVSPACSSANGSDRFKGASADGARAFFISPRQLADSDLDDNVDASGTGTTSSGSNLIVSAVATTGAFAAGQEISGPGISAGTTISNAFGETLVLSAPVTGPGGSGVPLTTTHECSGTAADGCDLYLYDSTPPAGQPNLVQASAGEVTDTHPTVGKGARVVGVTGVASDGSRAYFVALGKLTAAATDGARNLYVFERDDAHPTGRISFIAKLSSTTANPAANFAADTDLWEQVPNDNGEQGRKAYSLPFYEGSGLTRSDGDGHLLVFVSEEKLLPGEDTDSVDDLYRYDDEAEQLQCLSCGNDGPQRVLLRGTVVTAADDDLVQQQRIASEDGGEIVFASAEQLTEEDENSVVDAYLWQQGQGLQLVSGATGAIGIRASDIATPSISADGQSVFFPTKATLLPEDTDNGVLDWYAARVDGGFPITVEAADPCREIADACPDPVPPVPPQPPLPSQTSDGPRNLPPEPRRCPQGTHRVKKPNGTTRCVRNRPKKQKKSENHKRRNRAGANGRVSR